MLKIKLFFFLYSIKTLFCACDSKLDTEYESVTNKNVKIKKIGSMPSEINESSGLETVWGDSSVFWTHNDGAFKDVILYKVNLKGSLLDTLVVPDVNTKDLEELAQDDKGNIFLGDFGNNQNKRKELKIIKFHPSNPSKQEIIYFSYPEQKAFPPQKEHKNFDCEAFFWFKNKLYLFSKNRGRKLVKMYTLPDSKGTYSAELKDSLFISNMITAADVNPFRNEFTLMAYGHIYIFGIENEIPTLQTETACVKFSKSKQNEAILYVSDNKLLISNEEGSLFLAEIKRKKNKHHKKKKKKDE